jgi:hypothetical protein
VDEKPLDGQAGRLEVGDFFASEESLIYVYHAPFPSLGYVKADGLGFDWLPAPWAPGVVAARDLSTATCAAATR